MLVDESRTFRFRGIAVAKNDKVRGHIRKYLSDIPSKARFYVNPENTHVVVVDFECELARNEFHSKFGAQPTRQAA